MNQGMFSEIKALLSELVKRFDKLIELVESQVTQQAPEASAPVVERSEMQVDEWTAPAMERDFESAELRSRRSDPIKTVANMPQVAAPAKPYFDRLEMPKVTKK